MLEYVVWLVAIVIVWRIAIKIAEKKRYIKRGIARLEHWINAKDENDSD